MDSLLGIENLSTFFHTDDGVVKSVRNVDLNIHRGETLGLVGESGCGKSVTALSAMRLIPQPPGRFESGRILFKGQDLLSLSESEMEKIRGNDISMIFQEPMTSLNPLFTIGDQVSEAIILHQGKTPIEAREITLEALRQVAIPSPEKRIDQYPHELSGGMKQRVMITMAIVCKPMLLIADEISQAPADIHPALQRWKRERLGNASPNSGYVKQGDQRSSTSTGSLLEPCQHLPHFGFRLGRKIGGRLPLLE